MTGPIDFDALVLGPAMAAFGQPIMLTPVKSQPGVAAYAARGVYTSKPIQIQLEDGGYHSTVQPTLGIRLGEFATAPMQGDRIGMPQGNFEIADVLPDGQGGADLVLRDLGSVTATTDEDGA